MITTPSKLNTDGINGRYGNLVGNLVHYHKFAVPTSLLPHVHDLRGKIMPVISNFVSSNLVGSLLNSNIF